MQLSQPQPGKGQPPVRVDGGEGDDRVEEDRSDAEDDFDPLADKENTTKATAVKTGESAVPAKANLAEPPAATPLKPMVAVKTVVGANLAVKNLPKNKATAGEVGVPGTSLSQPIAGVSKPAGRGRGSGENRKERGGRGAGRGGGRGRGRGKAAAAAAPAPIVIRTQATSSKAAEVKTATKRKQTMRLMTAEEEEALPPHDPWLDDDFTIPKKKRALVIPDASKV